MNGEDFQKEYEKSYHFFLSELKGIENKDLAFLVELMRCSQHIKDFLKLMIFLNSSNDISKEKPFQIETDSLNILILNISAAQLRESLKLFFKFSKTEYFKTVMQELSADEKKVVDSLINFNDEFNGKKGFIYEVLKPLRDSVFHYLPDKDKAESCESWIEKIKNMEGERKPPYQSVNVENCDFGPGKEYDAEIYSKYLFWGDSGFNSILKAQMKVFEIQNEFLKVVSIIVKNVLKKEKIPVRKFGWFMEFFHGYKL